MQRTVVPLGIGAAAMNAAMAVASTAATLEFGDRVGMAFAGAPAMAGIVGTAAGSVAVARLTTVLGTRVGLAAGYLVGAAGIAVTALVTLGGASRIAGAVAVVLGMVVLGVGNAAAQLSRYAAAETAPSRPASAIAVVVWLTTVGAVGGPLLLGPVTGLAGAVAGVFVLAACCAALAAAVLTASAKALVTPGGRVPERRGVAPAGGRLVDVSRGARPGSAPTGVRLFATPTARRAFAAMAAAQVVMVAVMTATPMTMHAHGSTTTSIGAVLSAHTFGMFAFSPLTGSAVDRWGARPVIRCGFAVLVVAAVGTTLAQAPALFLLGVGWNLSFIAGSGVLAAGLPETGRLRVEAKVEAAVWTLAAVAALASTVLLAAGGAPALAITAVVLVGVAGVLVR